MKNFRGSATLQNNTIRKLKDFLESEERYDIAKEYNKQRFEDYALETGYENVAMVNPIVKHQILGINYL